MLFRFLLHMGVNQIGTLVERFFRLQNEHTQSRIETTQSIQVEAIESTAELKAMSNFAFGFIYMGRSLMCSLPSTEAELLL